MVRRRRGQTPFFRPRHPNSAKKWGLTPFLAVAVLASACGPRRLALPAGPGTPFNDFIPILEQASADCRLVRTLTAELALSGRAGRQRIRGRVLAGLAPDALRLEGAAPFGGPVFIFVARGGPGDLLLPRRREVLRQAPPAEILDALAGISLTPDDLRAVLSGCVKASVEPISARAYANEWLVIELSDGALVYLRPSALREPQGRPEPGRGTASSGRPELVDGSTVLTIDPEPAERVEGRRQNTGAWAIVGGRYSGLEIEYAKVVGGRPEVVRVRSIVSGASGGANAQVDLEIRLSQVETNVDIDPAAFTVQVPPGTVTISLEELREAGPLGTPQ